LGGKLAWTIPNNATLGLYDVEVSTAPASGFNAYESYAVFTVTGPTPVPETPSVLGLLLPALLVGIYVSRRKRTVR